ncbi:hypothetical protein NKH77_44075 [Streptomyces sp. M19]
MLAVVTRRGVAVRDAEVPDPAQAAVWGVVRAAQAEHPGRFLVVDTEPDAAADGAPEWAPCSAPTSRRSPYAPGRSWRRGWPGRGPGRDRRSADPGGRRRHRTDHRWHDPVGASLARHLAAEHGVRDLLLLGEPGESGGVAEGWSRSWRGSARGRASRTPTPSGWAPWSRPWNGRSPRSSTPGRAHGP